MKGTAFNKVELLYVHCVSKEKLSKRFYLRYPGLQRNTCEQGENMSERQRCLVPDVMENLLMFF